METVVGQKGEDLATAAKQDATTADLDTVVASLALLKPATTSTPITPHDSNAVVATKGLTVDGAGDLVYRLSGDVADRTRVGLAAGSVIWGNVILVKATGTTASGITGYN